MSAQNLRRSAPSSKRSLPIEVRFRNAQRSPVARPRSAPQDVVRSAPTVGVPRTLTHALRVRTILRISSREYAHGAAPRMFPEPFLMDVGGLGQDVRELVFAEHSGAYPDASEASARSAVDDYLRSVGCCSIFEAGSAMTHRTYGSIWIPGGGFVFALLRRGEDEPWGQLMRSDDDLWLRASLVVDEV